MIITSEIDEYILQVYVLSCVKIISGMSLCEGGRKGRRRGHREGERERGKERERERER